MKLKLLLFNLFFSILSVSFSQENDESFEFNDNGKKLSIGISILDGFGVPVRYYLSPQHVFDIGPYYTGIVIQDANDNYTFSTGFILAGGFTYFGKKYIKETRKKTKIRANGIAMRGSYLFGDLQSFIPSFGWARETSRMNRPNRSFIFELGIQGIIPINDSFQPSYTAGIYLRCHWNFFL